MRLETGCIISNADPSINLLLRDSFHFCSTVECAPLKSSGYRRNVTGRVAHRN
jgi:hypothetical protein